MSAVQSTTTCAGESRHIRGEATLLLAERSCKSIAVEGIEHLQLSLRGPHHQPTAVLHHQQTGALGKRKRGGLEVSDAQLRSAMALREYRSGKGVSAPVRAISLTPTLSASKSWE